jgi:surface-anchored protein
MKIQYDATSASQLTLSAFDTESRLSYPSNQVVLVVKQSAMTTLLPGTPFGNGGDPIWILPETPDPALLTIGYSAEGLPAGVFSTPFEIKLKRAQGPGNFFLWLVTQLGTLDVNMNSRDGITGADQITLPVGAHEHYFWGFTAAGVYCLTFQIVGTLVGQATPITSPETTFVFHVLPLPSPTNYSTWAKGYWPPGFNPPTTLTNGNPDVDLFNNLFEYAFNLSPTNANGISNAPLFSFVITNGARYGSLTFTRYKPALDLIYTVEATSTLPGSWTSLTDVFGVVPNVNGVTEIVTMRDSLAVTNRQRFFRLRISLIP